jgi:hypothetical protein
MPQACLSTLGMGSILTGLAGQKLPPGAVPMLATRRAGCNPRLPPGQALLLLLYPMMYLACYSTSNFLPFRSRMTAIFLSRCLQSALCHPYRDTLLFLLPLSSSRAYATRRTALSARCHIEDHLRRPPWRSHGRRGFAGSSWCGRRFAPRRELPVVRDRREPTEGGMEVMIDKYGPWPQWPRVVTPVALNRTRGRRRGHSL